MNKCVIMVYRSVPPDKHPFEGKQPCNGAFYLPSSAITPEWSAVLRFRIDPIAAMRSNQLDAFFFESFIQCISVVGTIPDNSSGSSQGEGLIDRSFDKRDFMW